MDSTKRSTPAPSVIRRSRRIAADPTSAALLVAGPSAIELWPGVRRVAQVSGRLLVEAEIAEARGGPAAASVRADPPRRALGAYVSRFEWRGPGLPATEGELSLAYAPGGGEGTVARLRLSSSGWAGSRLDQSALARLAEGFLDNLAHRAEERSTAA